MAWILDLQRPWQQPRSVASSSAETIAIDREGARIATGTQTALKIWDARTGAQLASSPLPGGTVPAPLAFSSDATSVLLSLGHGQLQRFEWATRKWTEDPRFQQLHAVSGDGRFFALRPDDRSIQIVEAETQRRTASLSFAFAPLKVGFGGGNKLLISIEQQEGNARVWDLESGKELAKITDFDRIHSAALSPDGRLAATVGDDGSVRSQLWRKEDLIRYACEIVIRPLSSEEWKRYLPEDAYAGNGTCPQFRSHKGGAPGS